jgi:myo-inositol-1(or 4)-monophosphatase
VTARRAPSASTTKRYSDLARVAAVTAIAVGDAIVQTDIDIVTRKKGRANFATAADHAAERAILKRLAAHDRAIPVLTEESPNAALRKAERLWVVDPIDGTLNFSRGIPFYCVVIAYVEDGRARAAAIRAPRTNETFIAWEGGGATCNGVALRVSRVRKMGDALAVASLSYRVMRGAKPAMARLAAACGGMRDVGSAALGIAYVADGRFDIFAHQFLSPWDIAAPALVAREAGARVLSLKTGEDAAWDERQVVIANPTLAREAMRLLRKA